MLLEISHSEDVHATAVTQELRDLGERVLLFDLATFPLQTTMQFPLASEATDGLV